MFTTRAAIDKMCVCNVYLSRALTVYVNVWLLIGLISFRLYCLFSVSSCWVLTIFSLFFIRLTLYGHLPIWCEWNCTVYTKHTMYVWNHINAEPAPVKINKSLYKVWTTIIIISNKWYRFKLKPNDFATTESVSTHTPRVRENIFHSRILSLYYYFPSIQNTYNICWIDALLSDYIIVG